MKFVKALKLIATVASAAASMLSDSSEINGKQGGSIRASVGKPGADNEFFPARPSTADECDGSTEETCLSDDGAEYYCAKYVDGGCPCLEGEEKCGADEELGLPGYCTDLCCEGDTPGSSCDELGPLLDTTAHSRKYYWLKAHNKRRKSWYKRYGKSYVPLKWSNNLKAHAQKWANHLARTKKFYHDSKKVHEGENLAWNSGKKPTAESVLYRWVEGEVGKKPPANYHLTQVLWRASKYVGCADASNGNYYVQVCRYKVSGNCGMKKYRNWKTPMLSKSSKC